MNEVKACKETYINVTFDYLNLSIMVLRGFLVLVVVIPVNLFEMLVLITINADLTPSFQYFICLSICLT